KADVTNLAGSDSFGHRSDGFLDRHAGIDAMLVPQFDVVDAEPFEAALERALRVRGRAVDAGALLVLAQLEAPLRGELHLIAPVADRRADDFFVAEGAVHLSGVDEGDTE